MNDFWNLIQANEGNTFKTVTGLEFTYKVIGNYIITSRTNRHLAKSNFEKAILMRPKNPSDMSNLIQGSSYVYAILNELNLI